jgi:hypothetical protein
VKYASRRHSLLIQPTSREEKRARGNKMINFKKDANNERERKPEELPPLNGKWHIVLPLGV